MPPGTYKTGPNMCCLKDTSDANARELKLSVNDPVVDIASDKRFAGET